MFLDENLRKTLRSRKSIADNAERRKSRRHSTGTTPMYGGFTQKNNSHILQEDYDESSSSSEVNNSQLNGSYKDSNKGIIFFDWLFILLTSVSAFGVIYSYLLLNY